MEGIFDEPLLQVYEEEDVDVIMFLDDGPVKQIERMRAAGKKLIKRNAQANRKNLEEAEKLGFDVLAVCGVDCGGHSNAKKLGTLGAVQLARSVSSLPLVVGGGIIDRKGVMAIGALGAEGVWAGTRFVATEESPVAQVTKDRMLKLSIDDCVQVQGIYGPIMSVPTISINKCLEMMADSQVKNGVEISSTYMGGYRTGMLLGDVENGHLDVSSVIDLITSIRTVKEVVDEFVQGME